MLKTAKWVSAKGEYCSPVFRNEFYVSDVESARLSASCMGFFEGFINGQPVSCDLFVPPYSDYHKRDIVYDGVPFDEEFGHRTYYMTYDVTKLLKEGNNAIGFLTGSGWYQRAHDPCGYGNISFCFCLEITHTDKSVEYITSGENTLMCDGFVKKADILNGETIDFNGFCDDFSKESADLSNWRSAYIVDEPETELMENDCPPDRVIRRVTPTLVSEENGVRIYDAGEMITGYPLFYTREGDFGEINIRYGELLDGDKLKEENIYLQHTDIIMDGKVRCVHSQFTWMCFRYFEVKGNCDVGDCLVIYADIAKTSDFECSSDTLNWLYNAYIRTQLLNIHIGIPSDCPHIERKGYTGDGQLTANACMTFLDAQSFYKKWIRDISDCQDRLTGHVNYCAPYAHVGGGPGGWGGAIVLVPYQYYRHYGDKSVLSELYPQMIRYFDYLEAHSEADLVTSDREGEWCLGEWCTPEQIILDDRNGVKLPQPFVNTYFYIKTMQLVLEIEDIIGVHEHTEVLKNRIEAKKDAIIKKYFAPGTGNFCSNQQGGNAFAIDIGMGDERTLWNIAEHYTEVSCFDTGIFGTELVTRILFENGYPELAIKLLISEDEVSFYNQKKIGATTLLENWNGVRSQCHPMFGAVSAYLAEYVLGIRQKPGSVAYDEVIINPTCMHLVKSAKGYITTPKGVISVEYNEEALKIGLPKGIKAEVPEVDRKIEYI